jgi:hypothetical protein
VETFVRGQVTRKGHLVAGGISMTASRGRCDLDCFLSSLLLTVRAVY